DGTGEIVTSYSYSWHPDSIQMAERVTTLPAVPAEQNGSGVSATRVERFDMAGRLVWTKDERGVIGYRQYDGAGNVTRTIQDVDDTQLAVPSGWSTPAGAGLHVVTDYEHDVYGRQTQMLGPEHEVDLDGTATAVRTATWTVYKEHDRETWSARGYYVLATDTYTLVNPVSIEKRDAAGTRRESIRAVRESTAGKLSANDSFPQSSYVRWLVNLSDNAGRLTASRAYHTIPSSGDGESGTNYDETTFGYDSMGRQNMVKSPGGTITRTVFNAFGQAACVYVGTDDSGATDYDPSAGREPCELVQPPAGSSSSSSSSSSAGSNNMVLVTQYEYAGSSGCAGCCGGGAGQLVATIQYVDAVETRVTEYLYDWRNRQQYVIAEADDQGRVTYTRNHYDSLDHVIRVERHHDVAGDGVDADGDPSPDDVLIARQDTFYDDLGRVYRTRRYAVDPETGAVGNFLQDHTWYDEAGNVIKQQQPGSQAFSKIAYDSLGRMVKQYVGYDLDEQPVESSSSSSSSSGGPAVSYLDATNVEGDTIVEQTEQSYDVAGNVLMTTTRQRLHNATGTGELTSRSGAQPRARVSYIAMWYDAIGRAIATANYGTNDGAALTRPSSVPARSDDVLVTSTEYNSAGEAYKTVDQAGREDRQEFGDVGRVVKTIQNHVDGVVSGSYPDEDVTVEMTYNADGRLSTLTAKNPTTGDQTTRYVYGTTLSESEIARGDLLRAEIYPDSDDTADPLGDGPDEVYDRVEYRYNRQGERIEKKDQNGTVHAYDFDRLGRLVHDRVTTVGTAVDNAALRISTTYDVRGLVEKTTTYDSPTAGSGSVVNEVVFEYNETGQPSKEYQEHSGAKDANTLYVGYNYDTTASSGAFMKGLRPTSVRYPNGRLVHFTYGSSDEMNDALNRLAATNDDNSGSPGSSVAEYTYLGLGTIIVEDYPEPDVKLNYDSGTAGEYAGFDRFGRVVDHLWRDYGAGADRDRYTYGYDRASNRLYRENTTASAKDEFYGYDGIHRLASFDRGDLNAEKTAISGTPVREEDWTLDLLGNWPGYVQKTSGTTDLDQGRTHSNVNEVTAITATTGTDWADPVYDRAGNMTTIPKPSSLASGLTAVYDAWNRLVEMKDGQTVVGQYHYDGLNRRIRRDFDSAAPANPAGVDTYVHYFYNANWQILETRQSNSGAPQAENLQPKHQYVWSVRYMDAAVLRDENSDQNNFCDDGRLYYLNDANFNVTTLVDVNADGIERYLYAAYGKVTIYDGTWANSQASTSFVNNALYTGREYDAETGLYYYRNRYYDSDLGVFVSRDPIGYVDGLSLYRAYFGPNRLDPLGRCDCCCCPESVSPGGITFAQLLVPDEPARFEFVFRVVAKMKMTEERMEPGGMCKIEWYECSTRRGSLGQEPGKWFRAPSPSDDPPAPVKSDWNDPRPSNCSDNFARFWEDAPTVFQAKGDRADIKFAVRVTAGTNCECEGKKEATSFFSLHVEVKKLDILFPENSVFDPHPPVLTPGLVGEPKACTRANLPW
ncbi:MAG: RHS repeat-associated core domain-containing protein, partial [Pirellulales bacterium]|nr:RHS repeat-associated core domain-containing protein [Pirellulales bacterium]